MSIQPPTIYLLAGPNGAGKTSLYGYEASGIPRLNGDTLYQQHQDLHEVEAVLRQQQEEWVRQKRSFVIETNAASARDYVLFNSLKLHGYRIELRYVGLNSVALCQERVTQRVATAFSTVCSCTTIRKLNPWNWWIFCPALCHVSCSCYQVGQQR